MKWLFSCLILLLISFFPTIVHAQEATPSPTPTQQDLIDTVDYTLPYPGLLPTNPLYPLKTFRDKVISLVIADPKKKSEFDLLQADKRLNAGVYLLKEGNKNEKLAVETISKGENYFFLSLAQIKLAQKQGENITDMRDHLRNASLKHQQVLEDLEKQVDSPYKEELQKEEQRVKGFENSAMDLMPTQ